MISRLDKKMNKAHGLECYLHVAVLAVFDTIAALALGEGTEQGSLKWTPLPDPFAGAGR